MTTTRPRAQSAAKAIGLVMLTVYVTTALSHPSIGAPAGMENQTTTLALAETSPAEMAETPAPPVGQEAPATATAPTAARPPETPRAPTTTTTTTAPSNSSSSTPSASNPSGPPATPSGPPSAPSGPPASPAPAEPADPGVSDPGSSDPGDPAAPPAEGQPPSGTTPTTSTSTTSTTTTSTTTTSTTTVPVDQAPVVLCSDLTLSVAGIFETYDYWLSQDCFSDPEGGSIQAYSTQGSFGSVTAPTDEYCGSLAGSSWCWVYQPEAWDGTPYWDSFNIWAEDAAGNQSAPIRVDLCLNC